MTEQPDLDDFLVRLGGLVPALGVAAVTGVAVRRQPGWVELAIDDVDPGTVLLSSRDAELTIAFGETHWHLDGAIPSAGSLRCACVADLLAILAGRLGSYSVWAGIRALGSGCWEGGADPPASIRRSFPAADRLTAKIFGSPRRHQPPG